MQACLVWVLIIFGTQVIKKKQPVRPVFPDYLSLSYDYDESKIQNSGASMLLSSLLFFHESILCESRNFDCDCDTYGSHIMLAFFCQPHEAAVEEML